MYIDIPGAENSAIDYQTNRIFVADGYDKSVNSMEFDLNQNLTYANITASKNILLEPAFEELDVNNGSLNISDITCVAMNYEKGYVVTTIVPANHAITNGWIGFIDPMNQTVFHLMEMEDCFLPDHVTTTYSGDIILVSCEGEPSENEEEQPKYNPAGSIGYIDVSSNNTMEWEYINIGFTDFDDGGKLAHLLPDDIYYPLPSENVSQSNAFSITAEPEHIVVDIDDEYAYIVLQENNAVAILDINEKTVINVFTLGYGYFGDNGGLDPSNEDGGIHINEYQHLYGMRQPDDMDFFMTESGRKFLFTANEGDGKGFDEERVASLTLDDIAFGENMTDYLKDEAILGRLHVSKFLGEENGTYSELYTFSSRDFTVFEICSDQNGVPNNISFHYSSDNGFENKTAELIPEGFNSNYKYDSMDSRSDDKGPEPEGLTVGECENGRRYVFICMERVGGIFAYDFTDIDNIVFADYVNNRNFSFDYDDDFRPPEEAGDIGPEQLRFIPESKYGAPLLVVSNPQSASVTMYRIDCGDDPDNTTMNTESTGSCPIYTTESPSDDDDKEESLTTLEIVAIAVGSFAIISIIILVTYIMCKRKNKGAEYYKYNSSNEFGNSGGNFTSERGGSGHYFELATDK